MQFELPPGVARQLEAATRKPPFRAESKDQRDETALQECVVLSRRSSPHPWTVHRRRGSSLSAPSAGRATCRPNHNRDTVRIQRGLENDVVFHVAPTHKREEATTALSRALAPPTRFRRLHNGHGALARDVRARSAQSDLAQVAGPARSLDGPLCGPARDHPLRCAARARLERKPWRAPDADPMRRALAPQRARPRATRSPSSTTTPSRSSPASR